MGRRRGNGRSRRQSGDDLAIIVAIIAAAAAVAYAVVRGAITGARWLAEVMAARRASKQRARQLRIASEDEAGRRVRVAAEWHAKTMAPWRFVFVGAPVAAWIFYAARGSYFSSDRAGGLVALAFVSFAAASICGYRALSNWKRSRQGARKWTLAAVPALALTAFGAAAAEPSVARARNLIASHHFDEARVELHELGNESDEELHPLWAQVRLADALRQQTCSSIAAIAATIDARDPQKADAFAHADSAAVAAATSRIDAGDDISAVTELACASRSARDSSSGRQLTTRIDERRVARCINAADWGCAVSSVDAVAGDGAAEDAVALRTDVDAAIRKTFDTQLAAASAEKDLRRRLDQETSALSLYSTYLAAKRDKSPRIATLQRNAKRDEQELARRTAAEAKAAAAAEAARIQAEEREQRRAEAAERRKEAQDEHRNFIEYEGNGGGPTPCADGTWSHSSGRGTCSHHGGIR